MNDAETSGLLCWECGAPIASARRWFYCGDRCSAIASLVRYSRRSIGNDTIDQENLRRRERDARCAGLEGRLPSLRIRDSLLLAGRPCAMCGADGAPEVDFAGDAVLLGATVRESDLRALCSRCHADEARRRYVGPDGRFVPSAPGVWARIEAAEPIVPRDQWAGDRAWITRQRLERGWPPRSAETRLDLERWLSMLGEASADGDDDPSTDPLLDVLNSALDRLQLPKRRAERLVRAIRAMAETGLDDLTAESLDGTAPKSPAPLSEQPVQDAGSVGTRGGEDQ